MTAARLIFFFWLDMTVYFAWFAQMRPSQRPFSIRLLIAAVLAVSQVILTMFALGLAVHALTPLNLSLLNLSLAGALIIRTLYYGRANIRREAGEAARSTISIVRSAPLLKILACLTLAAIVWLVFLGVVYPPVDWDSLMYHLPPTAFSLQNHSLHDPPLPPASARAAWDATVWIRAFPRNIELLFLWTTMMTGRDTLTDLVELVFGILGIVAVYSLARRIGVEKKWAIAAGLLFFLTPVVLAQSRSNLIDLSTAVLILIAFVMVYPADSAKASDIVVAGLAAGIVLGAKWSGILFFAWLWLLIIGQRLYMGRSDIKRALSTSAAASAFFVGPALLLGGYWYIKNLYLHANPLWPFSISFFGRPLFDGLFTQAQIQSLVFPRQLKGLSAAGSLWTSWRELYVDIYDPALRLGGLGPFWFIFALPALAYLIKEALRRSQIELIMLITAFAGMLLLHPENWVARYTMFLAGVGAAAFGLARSKMRHTSSILIIDILVVLTAVYSIFAAFAPAHYSPAKIGALLAIDPSRRTPGTVKPEYISTAYDYIALNTLKAPANIGYGSGLMFTYPLWGTELRNRVYYIGGNNSRQWRRRLRTKRIDYLLLNIESPEFRFAKNNPILRKAFYDRKWGYAVYEVHGRTN